MASDFDPQFYYQRSLAPEDRERLPAYAALVDALGASEIGRALLREVRPEQRNPMLILAALHFQALRGDPVLAPLYAKIADLEPRDFARDVVARLEECPALVRDELHRATQTNEIGRSAVLVALLAELCARGVTDIHLIDVGTSMGLNLYPDFYFVNEPGHGALSLTMEELSPHVTTHPLPRIHERIGIDLNPLSPNSPEDVAWLRACLWPEEPQRAERFDAVLEAMKQWPIATRLAGSAVSRIDDALELCPPEAVPVIFHSWAAGYFSPDEQVRWREKVLAHVEVRAIWCYLEHPSSVPGLAPPAPDAESPRKGGTQIVVALTGGEPAHWGWSHPHGRWIALSPHLPE